MDSRKERAALAAVEVPERATEKGNKPAPAIVAQPVEVLFEISNHAMDLEAFEDLREPGSSGAHGALGDVDRDIRAPMTAGDHRAEKGIGLLCRPRAELDEFLGLHEVDDLRADPVEDLLLGTRRVVLRQSSYLLEEAGAALVVEVLWRELFGVGRETGTHVFGKLREKLVTLQDVDANVLRTAKVGDGFHVRPLSSRRRPLRPART